VLAACNATSAQSGGVEGPTALSGDARSVWIADSAGQVRRVDARTRKLRFLANVGGYPDSLALGAGTLWVSVVQGFDCSVVRLSRTTGRRIGHATYVGNGQPLRLAVGSRTVFLVNAGDRLVWRINARSGRVEGATAVAAEPWESATVTADARGAWIAYYSSPAGSVLLRLDRRGDVVERRRIPHVEIVALAIDRGLLLAVGGEGGKLFRLDARTGRPRAPTVLIGRDPIALTVGLGGVWVSDLGEQLALRRIDVASGRVTAGPYRAPGRAGRADDIAIAGGSLWATNAYGITSQIDWATGRSVRGPIRTP
jgi:outer membrane protein assembly factor BamB